MATMYILRKYIFKKNNMATMYILKKYKKKTIWLQCIY